MASQMSDMARLTKDTVVTVYHASDEKSIFDFCLSGIDAKTRTYRLYPHYISDPKGGKPLMVNRGLFVTPNLKTAAKFGRWVIKFKTTAKSLVSIFPKPDMVRQENKEWIKTFPHSYNPTLSAYLTGKAWSSEPQALYRGLLSPRAIEAVYMVDDPNYSNVPKLKALDIAYKESSVQKTGWTGYAMSVKDFIKFYESKEDKSKSRDLKHDYYFEPQQTNLTVEQFIQGLRAKLVKDYGQRKTDEQIESNLKYFIEHLCRDLGRQSNYQQQLRTLVTLDMGTEFVPYTLAKRLLPKLLIYYGIEKKPNKEYEPERYYGG